MSDLSSQLKWNFAKAGFYFNRFSVLPRAERLFRDVPAGTILERKLFGHRYMCDVSRRGPQKLIYLVGERFISEASLVRSLLHPGMTIVDVGANVGYYTLMFAQAIGSTGRIIAIEPSPENLPELRLNVDRNKLRNVKIISKAVGNERKLIGLRSGINSGVVRDDVPAFSVEQDLIDNIITTPIDVVKIDVEGYEGFVIEGAHRVLLEYRPIVFLEVHPIEVKCYGSSVRSIIENLSRIYKCVSIYEQKKVLRLHEKVFVYYAGISCINKVIDGSAYTNRCEIGEIQTPFWIVCRR
jgi:FkbM family methyltransferase